MESNNNIFNKMSLNELDSVYSVLSRGNGAIAAKEWMSEIENNVDKHLDQYKQTNE